MVGSQHARQADVRIPDRPPKGLRPQSGVYLLPDAGISNAFTIDVEDYFQVSAFEEVISRGEWDVFTSRVEDNTRKLLDLLDRHATKATCFVLGWVAERYPELVREIDARGHEVACHGYSHRLIYNQTPTEFAEETLRGRDVLEQIVGRRVVGYRAASYSITQRSLWALDTLIELGFTYDSSVFPVRHDRYGIPGAPRFPHVIERSGGSIIELPISTLKIGGYHLPVGGGGYFRIFPYWLSAGAIAHLNRKGKPAMFYVHPWEVDPEQPRIAAGLLSRFRHYHHLDRCEQRLDRLLSGARFNKVEALLRDIERGEPLPRMLYSEAGISSAPAALADERTDEFASSTSS